VAEKKGPRRRGDRSKGERWWQSQGGAGDGGGITAPPSGRLALAVVTAPKVELGFGVWGGFIVGSLEEVRGVTVG
jgi:hypothetical protein